MKTLPTYTATIYVGTREQYTPTVRSIQMAREWIQEYVNKVGLCVTLTPTEFVYTGRTRTDGTVTDAGEPGIIVGLINYPRFPTEASAIREKALAIGRGLLKLFKQFKVTVVFPDETVMLEDVSHLADKHLAGSSVCPCSPCTHCMTPEEERLYLEN